MRAHHRARALPVDIEVASEEFLASAANLFRIARIDRAGEPVFAIVGELQGMLEIAGASDRQHGAEDLLAEYARGAIDVGENGGRDKIASIFGTRRVVLF